MSKNLPNSDILERAYIVWIFHNPKLREQYLQKTLPAMFYKPERRLLMYALQKMDEKKIEFTASNVALFISNNDDLFKPFMRKHRVGILTEEQISDMLFDTEITSDVSLFDSAKDYLIVYAFARFVEQRIADIQYYNSYTGIHENKIIANAKGIIKVHEMLHGRLAIERDQLEETKKLINSDEEYISTSSQVINSFIGGWTRGYVGSLIAKSSHNKSTWIDYDTAHSLLSKKIIKAIKISPEESAATSWRRIIAMILKIPTSHMRQKLVQVTDEHLAKIANLFKDKYIIYDRVTKYKDIIDLMYSVKADKVIIDHLQAIEYPGKKDFLSNMIGNIPGMVDHGKKVARLNNSAVIYLSQVTDKEIQRSDRLSKAPRYYDAYGSSVLYQAAREFLSLYYPIKDYEDNPIMFSGAPPTPNDVVVSVEKSSFSGVGKIKLDYNPEFATFRDKPTKSLSKSNYIPPSEKPINQMGMFDG